MHFVGGLVMGFFFIENLLVLRYTVSAVLIWVTCLWWGIGSIFFRPGVKFQHV